MPAHPVTVLCSVFLPTSCLVFQVPSRCPDPRACLYLVPHHSVPCRLPPRIQHHTEDPPHTGRSFPVHLPGLLRCPEALQRPATSPLDPRHLHVLSHTPTSIPIFCPLVPGFSNWSPWPVSPGPIWSRSSSTILTPLSPKSTTSFSTNHHPQSNPNSWVLFVLVLILRVRHRHEVWLPRASGPHATQPCPEGPRPTSGSTCFPGQQQGPTVCCYTLSSTASSYQRAASPSTSATNQLTDLTTPSISHLPLADVCLSPISS